MADSPANDKNINRLVSELSVEERQNLLEKLKGQTNLSAESLYAEQEDEAPVKFEEQYAKLPWYYRLYYFIIGLFKSLPAFRIFEDSQVGKLGREIEEAAPGLYDYQKGYLLAEFYRAVTDLKEAARFFFTALDSSVNRDKGGFYAYLGSLEMGDAHRKLQAETDPNLIAERAPDASETELRQTAFRIMEDAFSGINEEQRSNMYANARSLCCLKELSSFFFDRLIMAFGSGSSASSQTCSVNVVRELLGNLNNILFSLQSPPPLALLQSLFIFLLQDKAGEQGFDINRETRSLLAKAENSLVAIREFNKHVPLTKILRCANRDMSLSPKQISGGEDWFLVYREYWKRHIEAQFADYMRDRRHRDLLNSFRYFLKGTNLKLLDNVVSDANPDGLPIREAFALSFLLSFNTAVFMGDINKNLRPILIDGEFYKRENRTEFTESYNDLIKLEDDIKKFESNISPSGDYGKRYVLAKQDMSSLPVKRRKIQIVLEDASRDAREIIERVRAAIKSMIKILNGILKKTSDEKYDTLGNLSQLAGKGPVFVNGINESIQKLQQTLQLLDDIELMEGGR
jgi:truncated hemoglobin YjbI